MPGVRSSANEYLSGISAVKNRNFLILLENFAV